MELDDIVKSDPDLFAEDVGSATSLGFSSAPFISMDARSLVSGISAGAWGNAGLGTLGTFGFRNGDVRTASMLVDAQMSGGANININTHSNTNTNSTGSPALRHANGNADAKFQQIRASAGFRDMESEKTHIRGGSLGTGIGIGMGFGMGMGFNGSAPISPALKKHR
eukprot:jgi/Hompol1/2076/HPOL_002817-RA